MNLYLDWAATSLPDPEILQYAEMISMDAFANPSSIHAPGKKALAMLDAARIDCATALGVHANTIYFTSGGTESNHIPLLSLLTRPVKGSFAVSAIEHPSILEQAGILESCGWKKLVIPVDHSGLVTPESVIASIKDDTCLVAVMAVNNETGAIQPIHAIADALTTARAGRKRPHFHVDAVQATGKIPFLLHGTGIDSASLSAHKIQGPRGIGILYLAHRIEPFCRGGNQESGIRPGTENVAGASAFAKALTKAQSFDRQKAQSVMGHLINRVNKLPCLSIIPQSRTDNDARFSPWVIQLSNKILPGEVVVRVMSDAGIFLSTGSACSSKKKSRPVLNAMHIDPDTQRNAFRVSIGPNTTTQDIDIFVESFLSLSGAL